MQEQEYFFKDFLYHGKMCCHPCYCKSRSYVGLNMKFQEKFILVNFNSGQFQLIQKTSIHHLQSALKGMLIDLSIFKRTFSNQSCKRPFDGNVQTYQSKQSSFFEESDEESIHPPAPELSIHKAFHKQDSINALKPF